MLKTALIFSAVSVFCAFVNFVYAQFSHGVRSDYMTFMFAYPLIGGSLVYLLIDLLPSRIPGRFAFNVYNSGIAALTVGSMLRGIFEIARTSSPYTSSFIVIGIVMMLAGAAAYGAAHFFRSRNVNVSG